jgi:glutathione S-transferase
MSCFACGDGGKAKKLEEERLAQQAAEEARRQQEAEVQRKLDEQKKEEERIAYEEANRSTWGPDDRTDGSLGSPMPSPPKMPPILAASSASLATPENPTPASNPVDAVLNAKGWTNGTWLLGTGSDACLRPAAYAAYTGIDGRGSMAEVNLVTVGFSDLQSDWFTTLSGGKCEMPLLISDGKVYGESCAITKFLFKKYEEPKVQAGAMSQEVFNSIIQEIDKAAIAADYTSYLLKFFAFCAMSAGAKPYKDRPAQEVQRVVQIATSTLQELDTKLQNQKFIVGDTFTAADCCWLPMGASLFYVTCMPVPRLYPYVWEWYSRCAQMQSFQAHPEKKDAGVSFFSQYPNFGGVCSMVWSYSRTFGSPPRHLADPIDTNRWYDACDPRPQPHPNAGPPDRYC